MNMFAWLLYKRAYTFAHENQAFYFFEGIRDGKITKNKEIALQLNSVLSIQEVDICEGECNYMIQKVESTNGVADRYEAVLTTDICLIEYAIPGMSEPCCVRVIGTREKLCGHIATLVDGMNQQQLDMQARQMDLQIAAQRKAMLSGAR